MVSAVICQLLWRELRKKIKNWMLRSILNFCFWTKNWSIDHALSDKSTKRGGTKCRSAQEEWGGGKERRDWSGVVGELSWGRALQFSAIFFNVGYVLATSLRKEGGNTTLECCFSLNMDAVNVDFVRDLVVTQGKTHSQVSLLLQQAYPGKRGLSSRSVTRKIGFQTKSWNTARNKLLLVWVFLLEILIFFFLQGKNSWIKKFFIK